jgi:hypothetical protein
MTSILCLSFFDRERYNHPCYLPFCWSFQYRSSCKIVRSPQVELVQDDRENFTDKPRSTIFSSLFDQKTLLSLSLEVVNFGWLLLLSLEQACAAYVFWPKNSTIVRGALSCIVYMQSSFINSARGSLVVASNSSSDSKEEYSRAHL